MPETDYQWRNERPVLGYRNDDQYYDRSNDNRTYGYGYGNTSGPVVRVRPRWAWVADQRAYVAVNSNRDYDMFRVGGWYYLNDGGTWYRADRWNGTWMLIDTRYVPSQVVVLSSPDRRRAWDRDWNRHRYRDRDRDRDRN